MLRKYHYIWESILSTVDYLVVLVAFTIAYKIYNGNFILPSSFIIVLLEAMVFSRFVFSMTQVYASWRGKPMIQELQAILISWLIVASLIVIVAFATKTGANISRVWLGTSIALSVSGQVLLRLGLRFGLAWMRSKGFNYRRIIVVGAGALGKAVVTRLNENKWAGFDVVSIFDDDLKKIGSQHDDIEVVGDLDDVSKFVEDCRKLGKPIDQVWVAIPLDATQRCRDLYQSLEDSTVEIRYVPSAFDLQFLNSSVDSVANVTLINLYDSKNRSMYEIFKVTMDFVLAVCALLILSPLMLLIAIAIKLDSRGPVIFKQRRYGIRGQEIVIWKFRTMKVMEDGQDVTQATKYDARITRVGKFLRKSSLDEVPQFFNVLQGRMSIVGPRPHAVMQNELYRKKIVKYMFRHKVKPGITGLAQVNGFRGETETDVKMKKRVEYDLDYIANRSVGLDAKIMVKTAKELFNVDHAY